MLNDAGSISADGHPRLLIRLTNFLVGPAVATALVVGGTYIADVSKFADTTVVVFGKEIAAAKIGLPMVFIGALVAVLTLRFTLRSLRALPPPPDN